MRSIYSRNRYVRPTNIFAIKNPTRRYPARMRNMDWKQAKKAYPKLSPFGDADGDGVMNAFDCKPFDFRKQDDDYTQKRLPKMIENQKARAKEMIRERDERRNKMNEKYAILERAHKSRMAELKEEEEEIKRRRK